MSVFKSLITGLEQAVEIENEKISACKQKVTIMPVEEFSNNEIKAVRESLKMTQVIFAQILGVSKKTVEAWEAGVNTPNGSAKRIIGMLKEDPTIPEKYHILTR